MFFATQRFVFLHQFVYEWWYGALTQMMALRQQQQQQQIQQHQQQQQGHIAGTVQSPFLQWNMPERSEATLQDFMEQQTNNSQAIVPVQMTRFVSIP